MDALMDGKLLRIYINETDKSQAGNAIGQPLHEVIVKKAQAQGLAGATVTKSIQGYGCRKPDAKAKGAASSCPLVIEIVDSEGSLDSFLKTLKDILPEGLVTVSDVKIAFYRGAVKSAT